jgi:ATP-binding cassette, subfamily B, bacterial PglK
MNNKNDAGDKVKNNKFFNMLHALWNILLPIEKSNFPILMLLVLMGMIFEIVGIGMLIPLMTFIVNPDEFSVFLNSFSIVRQFDSSTLEIISNALLYIVIIVFFVKVVFLTFFIWWKNRYIYSIQARLSTRLFEIYMHQTYTFHLERNSAELVRNATVEVTALIGYIVQPIVIILTETLVFIGIVILLFTYDTYTSFISVVFLLLVTGLIYMVFRGKLSEFGKVRLYHEGKRIKQIMEGIGGAKDLKILGRESEFINNYKSHTDFSIQSSRWQKTFQMFPPVWLEMIVVSGLVVMILFMIKSQYSSENILIVLGLFAGASFRLIPSVNRIISSMQLIRYGFSSAELLKNEFSLSKFEVKNKHGADDFVLKNILKLQNISYQYPNSGNFAVNNIDILIKKGTTIGIIGPSGSGKSTLVNIFLGLVVPSKGNIYIDNNNIHDHLRSWQNNIGYVPQSIFLADDSIRKNIAFGVPVEEIDNISLNRAVKNAQLKEFIDNQLENIETIIGENGVRISGGQRQRIGIARALYHNPSILVFDEATSSLDSETEKEIMKTINNLHGLKTILIIAHRLTTLEQCDHLYKIENGSIVTQGTPKELL